ncbi:MAG: hypothetical protein Phog2KO_43710 [Phototrophicaceae bacterium]
MENDSFRLIVRRGPRPNEVYELTGEITNLGRDITNDIVINDREASRHHLRFTRGGDGYTIEDLGSTNGTFINGKRLTGATSLKNGDMVGLGETVTLQFEAGRPNQSPAPQASSAPAQAPQETVDSAYRPPAQQVPSQPSPPPQPAVQQPDPYSAPQSAPQQYVPPQNVQPQYQQAEDYAPPQDYYNQQGNNAPAASYGPPPPGYDYDPYAIRDEDGGNNNQWLLIGCLGLLLLCCCLTVVAAVAIDSFCLYENVPILNNVLNALSVPVNCP